MAHFEYMTVVAAPPQRVFDFLADVWNLPTVSPEMQVIAAPPRLALGSRFTTQVRKFGLRRTVTSEVTAFDEGVSFTDVQVRGPFRRLEHTHVVEPAEGGTRMKDRIRFEPPGRLLGWVMTERRLMRIFQEAFRRRERSFATIVF